MPSALDFLRRVLPAEGHYCLSSSRKPGGNLTLMRPHQDASALEKEAQARALLGHAVGVSLGAWADAAGATARKRAGVTLGRAWAVDLDVGAGYPYPDVEAALRAAQAFRTALSLPPFTVVGSGTGLHLYWSADRDLPIADWQQVADGLRGAFARGGLEVVDHQVTGDPSSPMRFPGSVNPKCNRPARLVYVAPAAPVSAFDSLRVPAGVTPADLAGESAPYQGPPGVFEDVLRGCRQVRQQVRFQAKQTYKSWHALLGVVSRCEQAEQWAHVVSKGHAGYDPTAVDKMLDGWSKTTGPTTCAHFARCVPGGCEGCPAKDTITTPLQLSRPPVAKPPAFVKTEVVQNEAVPAGLPDGYRVGEDATWRFDREEKKWVRLVGYPIYVTRVGPDADYEGRESVSIAWRRRTDDWEVTTIPCAHVSGQASRDLSKDLGAAGIPLSQGDCSEVSKMLRGWIENINKTTDRIELRNSMGWDDRAESFTLGFHRIHRDAGGKVAMNQARIGKGAEQLAKGYGCRGDVKEWYEAVGYAYQQGMMAIPFAVLVSLSAPLWRFQGLPGCSVCLYSPESGTGKTAALKAAQSVYGDPRQLLHSAHGSLTAKLKVLGVHNHTLMTIDEMTPMIAGNPEMMGELLYAVGDGKEKHRLDQTAKLRESGSWNTVLMFSSNISAAQSLEAARYHSPAQAMRLMDLRVAPNDIFSRSSAAGQKLVTSLEANYGHLGLAWIGELVSAGPEEIATRIEHWKGEFELAYPDQMSSEERFWRQLLELSFVAGEWLTRLPFDSRAVVQWALDQVGGLREQVEDLDMDAYALVSEFLVDHEFARVVVFQDLLSKKDGRWKFLEAWPKQPVRVRIEVDRKGSNNHSQVCGGRAYLDWTTLRKWLAERGQNGRLVFDQLVRDGVVTERGRKSLGAYTGHRTTARNCLGLDLAKHPSFRALLDAASLPSDAAKGKVVPIWD